MRGEKEHILGGSPGHTIRDGGKDKVIDGLRGIAIEFLRKGLRHNHDILVVIKGKVSRPSFLGSHRCPIRIKDTRQGFGNNGHTIFILSGGQIGLIKVASVKVDPRGEGWVVDDRGVEEFGVVFANEKFQIVVCCGWQEV